MTVENTNLLEAIKQKDESLTKLNQSISQMTVENTNLLEAI